MDLRLLDDIIRFMFYDNLGNRFDQFIAAGSALGIELKEDWRKVFFDHLELACDLHDVEDVYIMEHRSCGAYEKLLGAEGTFDDTLQGQADEFNVHKNYALKLTEQIASWSKKKNHPLIVRSFLMDLRGDVAIIHPQPERHSPGTAPKLIKTRGRKTER